MKRLVDFSPAIHGNPACIRCIVTWSIALWLLALLAFQQPVPVYGDDQAPTQAEKDNFKTISDRFQGDKRTVPHAVDDVLKSFDETVKITITCPDGTKYQTVEIVIKTKLGNYQQVQAQGQREGDLTGTEGGVYGWTHEDKIEGKKKTVTADNTLVIDPQKFGDGEGSETGKLDNERTFYHELLHGQLLIDAMKGTDDTAKAWQKKVCESNFTEDPADGNHQTINGLELTFLRAIAQKQNLIVFRDEIKQNTKPNKEFRIQLNVPQNIQQKDKINFGTFWYPKDNIDENALDVKDEGGKYYLTGKVNDPNKPTVIILTLDPLAVVSISVIYLNLPNGTTDVIFHTLAPDSLSVSCAPPTPNSPFPVAGFQSQWQQGEALAANYWGPTVTVGLQESYAEATDGQRLVQYFDKGRMELTHPASGIVTNGLLANELISGQLQLGDATFQPRSPANIPIAGDPDNPGPTYAALGTTAAALLNGTPAQTGTLVTTSVAANGTLAPGSVTSGSGLTALTIYDAVTQHNVPAAFAAYRDTVGLLTIGYAKSEPFLTTVKVGGVPKQVMVQVFERRVLTYTADNPDPFKVEMGNIGQHYYKWRYCTA